MEELTVKIGWSGKNYDAAIEHGDDLILATGKTLEDVKKAIAEAVEFHFEDLPENEGGSPIGWKLGFDLQPSAILKALDGIVSRATISRVTHIHQKQLGHYIQGRREGRPETKAAILEGIAKIRAELDGLVAQ